MVNSRKKKKKQNVLLFKNGGFDNLEVAGVEKKGKEVRNEYRLFFNRTGIAKKYLELKKRKG